MGKQIIIQKNFVLLLQKNSLLFSAFVRASECIYIYIYIDIQFVCVVCV